MIREMITRFGLGSAGIHAGSRLLALAMGIFLARTLGAEGYGIYAYAFAVMSLLAVAAQAGVPALLLREVAVYRERDDWSNLRATAIRGIQIVAAMATIISVVGLIVLWWVGDQLALDVQMTTQYMLLVLPLAALVTTIGHVIRGLEKIVTGQVVESLLRPLLVLSIIGVVFVAFPFLRQPQYAMAAQIAAGTVALMIGLWVLVGALRVESVTREAVPDRRHWPANMLPFALISCALVINGQADIIMLGWLRTSEEVGVYRVAVQGATVVAFSLQVANIVVAPKIAALYVRGDSAKLQRLMTASARVGLLAALPVGILFVFGGGVIAAWVFGEEFLLSHTALAILSFAQLASSAFGSVGILLNMTGHERETARALWQTTAVNVMLNTILIPTYGMVGAAIATAFSMLMWNIILFQVVRRRLGINPTAFRFASRI